MHVKPTATTRRSAGTRRLAVAALAALALIPAGAGAAGPDQAERHTALTKLETSLVNNYVFPDRGNSAAAALAAAENAGEFASAADGAAFAKAVSAKLADLLHDKHLRLFYDSAVASQDADDETMTPERYARHRDNVAQQNFGIMKVARLRGNVGYIDVRMFPDAALMGEALAPAMLLIAHTDALILDLRHNGGGDPAAVALLCSYFFVPWKDTHLNDIWTRNPGTTTGETQQYWTTYVPGPRYLDKPVYVLTSAHTFSGAEEFAYDMQTQKRATLVGEVTGGGANPGDFSNLTPHFSAFVPTGRAINPITGTNWEGVGVKPDVAVTSEAALSNAYLSILDHKLQTLPADADRSAFSNLIDEVRKDPTTILLF